MPDKHNIVLENRKTLRISGVSEVESSDNSLVKINTVMGKLIIVGSDMTIDKIDVESGEFCLKGEVRKLEYKSGAESGKFSSLFK